MTQEKLSRMITGIVAACTLFLLVLFGVLVYQWVTLGTQQRRLNMANAEYEQLMENKAELEEDLEDLKSDDIIKFDLWMKYFSGQAKK